MTNRQPRQNLYEVRPYFAHAEPLPKWMTL
jgi:hypothetical protein